jgi:hypothetical protein
VGRHTLEDDYQGRLLLEGNNQGLQEVLPKVVNIQDRQDQEDDYQDHQHLEEVTWIDRLVCPR